MSKLRYVFLLGALLAASISIPDHAAAKAVGGITVSPALQSTTISHDQASKSFDFSITNNDPLEQELHLSAIDFGSLDDTGGVLFLGPEKALNYKYGLAHWITLEKDVVVLRPHETQKVIVTITNKDSLAPGGHYGAIMVTPMLDHASTKQSTQVNQVASALLFLTKEGGTHYSMKLTGFNFNTWALALPGTTTSRFQNDGNVQVIPRGLVTITDPRGRIVKKGIINSDSGLALPESFREFMTPLSPVAAAYTPGVYHARISYYYEGQVTAQQTQDTRFYYINGWYGVCLIVVLCTALYFLTHRPQWARLRNKCSSLVPRPGRSKQRSEPSAK